MSPQRSNRVQLLEGTLRCLERMPAERVTARAIAKESGANLASISYHFGSKDDLVTEAVIAGLDRWLAEVAGGLDDVAAQDPAARFRRAAEVIETSRRHHMGLARNFVGALAKAQHDPRVRDKLADGFRRTRPNVAALLGLGGDREGETPPAWCSGSSTDTCSRCCSTPASPSRASACSARRPGCGERCRCVPCSRAATALRPAGPSGASHASARLARARRDARCPPA